MADAKSKNTICTEGYLKNDNILARPSKKAPNLNKIEQKEKRKKEKKRSTTPNHYLLNTLKSSENV